VAVGSDSWVAALFVTGTNASGYVLDSVQLGMTDATGSPSSFTVFLYSAAFGASFPMLPFSNIGTFNGSLNPTTGGIYTFTSASNLMVSADTTYFIVISAGTAIANGAYNWSYAGVDSYNPSEG